MLNTAQHNNKPSAISASRVFVPIDNTLSLLAFMATTFNKIPQAIWQQRFNDGLICSTDGIPLAAEAVYSGVHVLYHRHVANEPPIPVTHNILAETPHLLVVDKPHYLPTTPTGQYVDNTLLNRLKLQTANPNLTPLHRLDRETAGVMLFCKTVAHRGAYQQLFATQRIHKCYHAIAHLPSTLPIDWQAEVNGHLMRSEPFYTMRLNAELPSNSHTHIRLLSSHLHAGTPVAKFALYPSTGKMHQLRVHMNSLNMPLLNDTLYPQVLADRPLFSDSPLQLLAKQISWIDPIDAQHYQFSSQLQLLF